MSTRFNQCLPKTVSSYFLKRFENLRKVGYNKYYLITNEEAMK